MFDKTLFDRNAYDRSVASDGIVGTLYSLSSMTTNLIIAYPVPLKEFVGSGKMDAQFRLLIKDADWKFDGKGTIESSELVLRLPLSIGMTGNSSFSPGLAAKTPFTANLTGTSNMQSAQDFVYQHMTIKLSGNGDLERDRLIESTLDDENDDVVLDNSGNVIVGAYQFYAGNLIMRTFMGDCTLPGYGDLSGDTILELPLELSMFGDSIFNLRRLGALNENVFELSGINLMPGEVVTIDTDLLSVFFGYRQDVSSVTTDSVFFELSPGENDITIETDSNGKINVTAIWQNRWL